MPREPDAAEPQHEHGVNGWASTAAAVVPSQRRFQFRAEQLARDGAAASFAEAVRHGPTALAPLPESARAATEARIADGFSAAFLTVDAFAGLNVLIAWTLPLPGL